MIWNKRYFDRGVLLVLIALEALLFFNFFSREIAWYPPLHSDQTVYLTQAYGLEERIFSKGLSELWKDLWRIRTPTGLLLPIEGAFAALLLLESYDFPLFMERGSAARAASSFHCDHYGLTITSSLQLQIRLVFPCT